MKVKSHRALLIYPPLYFSDDLPSALDVSVPPLGILCLASYVNHYSRKVTVEVLDVAAEGVSLSQIAELVNKNNYFAVGISSMTPQLQGAVEIARFLKENVGSQLRIIIGGQHVSADPGFIKRFGRLFDYEITGEAEKILFQSLEKLAVGQKIPRFQSGSPIADLDTIPFPDRSLIKRAKYGQRESMMFSRGCPYNCYYCSRPSISKNVRYRSTANMIEEIKLAWSDCQGKIDFQDDSFTINRAKVIEFCCQVIKEKIKIWWACNTRIDLVDDELLIKMKEAGCELIHFGVESGNERVRREVVKKGNFSNNDVYRVFELCRKLGIKVGGYFMIGHPGETEKELLDTEKMILSAKIDLLGLSIPTPFPGSALYQEAEKRKIINEKIIDRYANKQLGQGYVGNYPVYAPEGILKADLYALMKKINRKFYLNFKFLFRQLRHDITSVKAIRKDFGDFISLILKGMSQRKPYLEKKK